jgi:NAD(P)-dependent dehydrogenase (short-subunit alcohol dehydrogenase family)
MNNPFLLEGKTILVTGASSGLGRQCAISISNAGGKVILVARSMERLNETFNILVKGDHLLYSQDITEFEKLDGMINHAVQKVGKISGFVHAAGIEKTVPFKDMQPLDYHDMISVNLIAGFELAKILTKKKYLHEHGSSFVFISSVMGILGQKGKVGYCCSKGSIISGCRAMALELAPKKTRINCILPGVVETEMTEKLFKIIPQESKENIISMHPLGLGIPDDVANACVFLLSDASRWITGANLLVDGGYSIS